MSNTPDGAHIVPASCVSMVTAGVCASSKVWRNLPDNPEGQHTELQLTALLCTHTLNPLRVCVYIYECVKEKDSVKMHFHLYMDMVGHPWNDRSLLSHTCTRTYTDIVHAICTHSHSRDT